MKVCNVDAKGRVTLGARFAGRLAVIVDSDEYEMTVRIIPEREEWVFRNPKVLATLERGLEQAKELR